MHPFFNPDGIGHPLPNPAPPHTLAHTLTWMLNGIREAPSGNVLTIGLQALIYLTALYLLGRWVRARRRDRALQAELSRSLAAHRRAQVQGQAEQGAGEWHVWPPRIHHD